jgi:hypothetical protein
MALAGIRQLLFKHSLNEVLCHRLLPELMMNELKWLNRLVASMKRDGFTAKYNSISRRGKPFLQHAHKGKPFQDCQ